MKNRILVVEGHHTEMMLLLLLKLKVLVVLLSIIWGTRPAYVVPRALTVSRKLGTRHLTPALLRVLPGLGPAQPVSLRLSQYEI